MTCPMLNGVTIRPAAAWTVRVAWEGGIVGQTCVASGSSSDISNMSGEEGQDNTDISGVEKEAQGSFSREGI